MKPKNFVCEIEKRVVNENIKIYRELLNNTNPNDSNDQNWKKALSLYQDMSESDKLYFEGFIKQIIKDTISNIFSILDGNVWLENQEEDFDLSVSGHKLNGELQDIFLEND